LEGRLDRLGGPPPTRVSGPDGRPGLPTDPNLLPELPQSYRDALDHGLGVLGLELSAGARSAIDRHVRLLLAWNHAINLTAIVDPAAIATRHVIDSLAAVPLLDGVATILDLGSGGGFPGLPLAAALPGARITLVDSVAKKARFLEVAAAGAGLADRVSIIGARGETLVAGRTRGVGWEAVVVRGVASLGDLIELAMPLLTPGGRLVAWKRGDLTAEVAAGARAARALGAGEPRVLSAIPGPADEPAGLEGHILVEVRKHRATPPGYPRDPAVRRRRSW
jgi:16S rRNA (guanine527-N7)-methyltransferase